MTLQESLQWTGLVTAWIGYTAYSYTLNKRIKQTEERLSLLSTAYNSSVKLILIETKRKEEQLKVLKRLTDPAEIEKDMERGARVREMHDANRTTLPRENAGPPAKVYTPQLRANVPRRSNKTPEN